MAFLLAIAIWGNRSNLFAEEIDPDRYLDSLIQQAFEKNLSQKRFWHLLLHYKKNIFVGHESEEDGPDFFNSPIGKADPQAELITTLKSFFQEPDKLKPKEEHPQCVFPARYKWLRSELAFDPNKLPEQRCARLESWLKALDPEKITLVFASYYMNNPASMFGHTLLRIDKKQEGSEQKLLNYAVNYAANIDTNNGLIYAFKGLFGMFKGIFSIFPYYTKVQEYSNWESRDLWEYELNFTEDQMNNLLLHLWELGDNFFNYFYFQENCSYHILSLLEVANPELHLTDRFLFYVIPADTIKALTHYDGLISKQIYRPSLLSQMDHKRFQMTDREGKIFNRLTRDPSWISREEYQRLSVPEKTIILDALLDYTQYRSMRKGDRSDTIDEETRKILLERSRLGYQPNDSQDPTPPLSTPPELGHGSAQIKIGVGMHENELFEEIAFRPAYHDLLAKDIGYSKDSQILFFDMTIRNYDNIKKFKLDSFRLTDIISLTPYDHLLKKKSWKFGVSIDTIKDMDCNYCNSFKGNYGIGISYKSSYLPSMLSYSLIDFEVELSNHLDNYYRAGGGGTFGALFDITDNWRIQLSGNYLKFPLGHESDYYKVSINQRYSIYKDLDIRIELTKMNDEDNLVFYLNYYF